MPHTSHTLTSDAYRFAALMAMLWVFFAIGAWYASRFDALLGLPAERPAILFGATFAVWFVSLFGYIGLRLIMIALREKAREKDNEERYA